MPRQSSFFISSKRLPDGERNTNPEPEPDPADTQSPHSSGCASLQIERRFPLFPHPGLTPVGDYVEACAEAVADAVLVFFVVHLLMAHPDPVAILKKLPC